MGTSSTTSTTGAARTGSPTRCVCVCERERGRVCVCVCVKERERERDGYLQYCLYNWRCKDMLPHEVCVRETACVYVCV